MRWILAVCVLVGFGACAPQIPDSGAVSGFDAYDLALEQGAPPLRQPVGAPATAPGTETATVVPPQAGLGSTAGPLLTLNNPGLSLEQDFDAVSAERDIAADAERLEAARQQYQLVTPQELERPGDTGPNIIDYALTTSHPIGQKLYRRSFFGASRAEERCEGYRTADVAQEEFLAAGGPERDRLGLDPDGDGYACDWDPATYRRLVRN